MQIGALSGQPTRNDNPKDSDSTDSELNRDIDEGYPTAEEKQKEYDKYEQREKMRELLEQRKQEKENNNANKKNLSLKIQRKGSITTTHRRYQ